MLAAAADRAILAGPVGAAPPMLDGGERSGLTRNWFQEENPSRANDRDAACPERVFLPEQQ